MGERGRPRDLYDIVNLYWRGDLRPHGPLIREALVEKCRTKGVPVPTLAVLDGAATRANLETEWENMLGHQLPALPPFESFWGEMAGLFAWLEGTGGGDLPAAMAAEGDEDASWSPPATAWTWGMGVALEPIRFAASNHLCVDLGYHGSRRVIEPYSLRRTRAGQLLLHALHASDGQHRTYRVDRIESVQVTTRPFRPVYLIEFAASGPMSAAPARGSLAVRRRHSDDAMAYIVQCRSCDRTFQRTTPTTDLRPHKDPYGDPCRGRHGDLIGEAYG
jgi:hypothetical protein